ncbi:MAG: 8-amino-7-oxononanoate synthase [Blastochloris sp.]|nr:8-amino-7-oxononanoate synthase [Blastochloris sp.]
MNETFLSWLSRNVKEDHTQSRQRQLRLPDPHLLAFCDNDYLGLSRHPALLSAAVASLSDEARLGAGAARLISGHHPAHQELEHSLAAYKQTQAALVFPTGYAAATGCLPALLEAGDTVILDKLAHACLIDGAKLSGARFRVFPHNDLNALENLLKAYQNESGKRLIVVESLYSMDGDFAPLPELVTLKERFGACLMVDEAHASGLYGSQGRGLVAELGLTERVEVQMGTLSKAVGCSGGFIAGSADLIQLLLNRARSFLFTTGTPPLLAAAASAALQIIQSEEGAQLRKKLFSNIDQFHSSDLPPAFRVQKRNSPIIPLHIGPEDQALQHSLRLQEQGFLLPAIRHPTVARGSARLRLTLNSTHDAAEIQRLIQALHN